VLAARRVLGLAVVDVLVGSWLDFSVGSAVGAVVGVAVGAAVGLGASWFGTTSR
jgi:hypothetical protein